MATPIRPARAGKDPHSGLGATDAVAGRNAESSDGQSGTAPKVRIAIVVSHPIQYYAPWYRALAETPGVILKVFFCRKWGVHEYYDRDFNVNIQWDIPLLDGYEWEFLATKRETGTNTFFAVDNPTVGEALQEYRPDITLIHGYAHRTLWRTVRWCNRNRVAVMLTSDSSGAAARVLWKRAAKAIVVRYFYGRLDGAISVGDNNRSYHRQYGLPEDRIFPGVLPIDCVGLANSAGDPVRARLEIRRQHGIPDEAFVVVFSGKLIPLKCVLHLLEAVHRCAQTGLEVWCMLVGDGPERPRVEAFVRENRMNTVVMAGFINQSSIGKYYAASDVVALMSSREAKGAPVPEAGVFGCPAILCDRVGCIGPTDCAREGENALVYPWSDIDALANCIKKLCTNKVLYSSMSQAARRIARLQDVTAAATQLKQAALQLREMGARN
jgi:glycosyltransferase involved in cell wall biosynthesis